MTGRFIALTASVLRTGPDRIDPHAGLNALGLDSLLAMELRARISSELGVAPPVVALLSGTPVAELITQLHDALAELVAHEAGGADAAAVEVFEDELRHPLTQNQKALWFLRQLNPEGYAYNIGGAVEVRVALAPDLMFEAVRCLVARHPALRTNFLTVDGVPMQQVSPEAVADVALFDVRDQEWEDIHRTIVAEYRKPYDLEHDPLFRFRLFKRADDRWVIMKAVHHIVSDAISTFTFIEELLAVYEGLRQGHAPRCRPSPPAIWTSSTRRTASWPDPRHRACSTTGARTCRPRSRPWNCPSTSPAPRCRRTTAPRSSSSWTPGSPPGCTLWPVSTT